jgi:RNA polymerase sigma-70 factor (ECF subfamily)
VLDEAAIERFVRDDYARLVNAVAYLAGSLDVAEEMVQEALARAWAKSSRGESIESLPNWVTAVALNLARSRWRRMLVERRTRERLSAATDARPAEPTRIDIERALATLPRRQREVAVLRYLIEMSTKEVAEVLRVSEGTIKNSLAKARKALAAQLQVDAGVAIDADD